MNSRWTLGLVLAALLVGGYVVAVDRPELEQRATRARDARRLLQFETSQVTAVEVLLAGGRERARVVREAEGESGWRLEAPIAEAADPVVIEGFLSALAGLSIVSDDPMPEADPAGAAFGLDQDPAIVLAVAAGDRVDVRFGDRAPIGSLRYLASNARPGRVLSVRGDSFEAFEPELLSLRDRRLMRLTPARVTSVEIAPRDAPPIHIERTREALDAAAPDDSRFRGERAWALSEPLVDQADVETVSELLVELAGARGIRIIDPPFELVDYGLAPEQVRVRIEAPEGRAELAFGRADDKVYARVAGRDSLLEVDPQLLSRAPSELFAYRFKRVLSIRRAHIESIQIEYPRASVVHSLVGVGEEWGLAASAPPAEAKQALAAIPRLRTYEVEAALHFVDLLQADGRVDDSRSAADLGLEPPRARFRFLGAGGRMLGELELGELTDSGQLAARSSTSERLWLIDPTLLEWFPVSAERFDRTWRKPEPPEPVQSTDDPVTPPAPAEPVESTDDPVEPSSP